MTCTLSTRGAAPSTKIPRATGVVLFALARLGEAPVNQPVLLERRIKRDVEEATLASGVDGGQPRDRFRQPAVGPRHAKSSGPFGHEHATIGQERQTPGVLQAFSDRHDLYGDVRVALGRTRLTGERGLLARSVRRTRIDAVFLR